VLVPDGGNRYGWRVADQDATQGNARLAKHSIINLFKRKLVTKNSTEFVLHHTTYLSSRLLWPSNFDTPILVLVDKRAAGTAWQPEPNTTPLSCNSQEITRRPTSPQPNVLGAPTSRLPCKAPSRSISGDRPN
jgi:hypothetical protein